MKRWIERWQPSESLVLIVIALVVGLASGAGVWLFKWLIEIVYNIAFEQMGTSLAQWGGWTVFLIPTLGGLIVGLIVHFFIGEERHHGVAGIMEAVALAGGRLRYQRTPAKAVAAAVSIGSGASVGPEDPSVQIGSNLGSFFGQRLKMSDERMRALVAAGAASGVAAAFNAPIAGVFFALEIILGEISGGALGVVVLASVISAAFTQATTGPEPAFSVPSYAFGSAWELPLYLGLGLLAGPIAALYIRLLYLTQDIWQQFRSVPHWVKPAIAGTIVGVVGIFLPQIFGVGYDTIEAILNGELLPVATLIALMVAKLILTPMSIAGGFQGGVFAPALFIGTMLGATYGSLVEQLIPVIDIVPAAFALVGMAAVLAGAIHAPLTAFILLFEMTNDYRIILPLMFAVVISMLIAQRLQRDSVYTLGLARKGIRLERGRDLEVLETLTVGEVSQPTTTLRADHTLAQTSEYFAQTHRHGVPIVNEMDELVGIFTLQDLDRIDPARWITITVGETCTRDLVVTYPDETIGAALRKMGARDIGRIPVVSRENPRQLLGILRRSDLVRSYSVALSRRAVIRHRAHQVRLDATTQVNVKVEEVMIKSGSLCAGKRINQIAWPRDCILATLRRGSLVLIPHGDTVLQPGDMLVAVAEGDAADELKKLCQTPVVEKE